MAFCLYTYIKAPKFEQDGCNLLDLTCSFGTYIQIKGIHCGMTSEWPADCDQRKPKDCGIMQKCCTQPSNNTSVTVELPPVAGTVLRQMCDQKVSCRQAGFDVVTKINDRYHRHYCMVTYYCRQGMIPFKQVMGFLFVLIFE